VHVLVQGVDVLRIETQVAGDLVVGGRPAQLGRQVVGGVGHLAGLGPHRAAGPVAVTQLVEQGAPDAGGGVPVEADPTLGIEAPGRLRQASHAGRHQVVPGNVTGHLGRHLGHRVVDEGQVLTHQLLLDLALLNRRTGC